MISSIKDKLNISEPDEKDSEQELEGKGLEEPTEDHVETDDIVDKLDEELSSKIETEEGDVIPEVEESREEQEPEEPSKDPIEEKDELSEEKDEPEEENEGLIEEHEEPEEGNKEDTGQETPDVETNISSKDDGSFYSLSVGKLEDRIDALGSEVRGFEEKIVSDESEELAKINDLENRVEKIELESDEDLEERIERLENRIESVESVKKFEERLHELEQSLEGSEIPDKEQVEDVKKKIDILWEAFDEEEEGIQKDNEEIRQKVEALRDVIDEREEDVSDVEQKVDVLWEAFDEDLMDHRESDRKFRLLWQAVDYRLEQLEEEMDVEKKIDNEMASVESRIHSNEQEIEQLYSDLSDLSSILKQQVRDSNH